MSTLLTIGCACRWCGPCKVLGPTLETAVASHDGKVMLAKVDVDDCGEIAMKYKVRYFHGAVDVVIVSKKILT